MGRDVPKRGVLSCEFPKITCCTCQDTSLTQRVLSSSYILLRLHQGSISFVTCQDLGDRTGTLEGYNQEDISRSAAGSVVGVRELGRALTEAHNRTDAGRHCAIVIEIQKQVPSILVLILPFALDSPLLTSFHHHHSPRVIALVNTVPVFPLIYSLTPVHVAPATHSTLPCLRFVASTGCIKPSIRSNSYIPRVGPSDVVSYCRRRLH